MGAPAQTGQWDDTEVTTQPRIRVVASDDAALHLWVSNQGPEDDPVVLTVTIDGIEVVAQPFEVRNQHTFVLFPLDIQPGPHEVKVISGTGVVFKRRFTMAEAGRQYAGISYWNYPEDGGRKITWHMQSDPIGIR